jgi:translation initiation factor IF-2
MANTPINEIFKDRRVQIGAAVGALLIAGGAFFVLNNGSGDSAATDTASAPPPIADPGAPVAPGAPPAVTGAPVAPGAPGSPTPSTGAANKPGAAPAAIAARDSWAGAPSSFPGGGGDGSGATPGSPGAPGAPAGAAPGKLPKPIRYGMPASLFRGDPFLSTQKFVVELPFAYQFVAPLRLASRPKPVVPKVEDLTPEERLGPIPRIPRRVAGVLYDGAVSAILETGTPGPEADVRVIQPGSLVPSGVPGLQDLTVSVITTTKVTLRDQYNRTVDVPLSTLPREVGEALRLQAGQQAGQGGQGGPGAPGGFPPGDGPGGPGAPGGFRGGGGGRGFAPGAPPVP